MVKKNNVHNQPTGGKTMNPFKYGLNYVHEHIMFLNSSKFFAGVIMILLNMGGKLISIQFSRSTEEYMKYSSLSFSINNQFFSQIFFSPVKDTLL